MKIIEVPVNKIKPDKNQPRKTFDQASIKEMSQSLTTEGIINPIEIDKDFVIVTGEMRWRAAKEAGFKTVPCKVIKVSPELRFRRQVVENIHHNTMSDWDTAMALKQLLDGSPATIKSSKVHKGGLPDQGMRELGRQIGKSLTYIIEKLDLLGSSEGFQKAVKENKLSASFLRAIKRAPEEFRKDLEKKIVQGGFTTRDNAILVTTAMKKNPEKAEQILKQDYTGADPEGVIKTLRKIVPDYTETPATQALEEALKPADDIAKAAIYLHNLLKQHSLVDIGGFNLPRVILALRSLGRTMEVWLEKGPDKQLTGEQ